MGSAPWSWTRQREAVALDLAVGSLTIRKIAAKHGIGEKTVDVWKAAPEVQERISEWHGRFREHIATGGIAVVENRVKRRDRYWEKLDAIVAQRAADVAMAEIPGGTTGLLLRKQRALGSGPAMQIIEEFEVDTGLLSALNDLENDTARDLGQRVDRKELSGPGGGPLLLQAGVTAGYQNGEFADLVDEFVSWLEAGGEVPGPVEEAIRAVENAAAAASAVHAEQLAMFRGQQPATD